MTGQNVTVGPRAFVVLCPECKQLGLVREVGDRCWMCGGWVGHEYPVKLAMYVSDMLRGGPSS